MYTLNSCHSREACPRLERGAGIQSNNVPPERRTFSTGYRVKPGMTNNSHMFTNLEHVFTYLIFLVGYLLTFAIARVVHPLQDSV
jgi:hypothetical protein